MMDLPMTPRPEGAGEGQQEQGYAKRVAEDRDLDTKDAAAEEAGDDVTPLPNKPFLASKGSNSVGNGSALTRMGTFTRNATIRYSVIDSAALPVGPVYEDLRGCAKVKAWI
jgi:hypothetical protein